MAKQLINLGTPNGHNGDVVRDAFRKVNENFTELYGNLQGVIPDPAGHSGEFLKSNGTSIEWVPAATVTVLDGGTASTVF